MPRGKKMQTPSKEPESSSMTHEEEEEMLHDISKLQEQVQQTSCSQKLTDAKINGMEAKINGVEAKMNGMEAKMDNLKIDLNTNLKTSMAVQFTHSSPPRHFEYFHLVNTKIKISLARGVLLQKKMK